MPRPAATAAGALTPRAPRRPAAPHRTAATRAADRRAARRARAARSRRAAGARRSRAPGRRGSHRPAAPAVAAPELVRERGHRAGVGRLDRLGRIARGRGEQQRAAHRTAQLVLVDPHLIDQAREQRRSGQGGPLALGIRGERQIDVTQLGHGCSILTPGARVLPRPLSARGDDASPDSGATGMPAPGRAAFLFSVRGETRRPGVLGTTRRRASAGHATRHRAVTKHAQPAHSHHVHRLRPGCCSRASRKPLRYATRVGVR